jgi:hypothetical protein
MSRNNNNNNNKSTVKYCKVCHDAGKSEAEYKSHFIRENREPNSKVVCPTLLSLECRYCSNKGHTVKYCKMLEKNKNMLSRQERANNYRIEPEKNATKSKQTTNIFDNLMEEEEEEEEEDNNTTFIRGPSPVESVTTSSKSIITKSYASVLSTPITKLAPTPKPTPAPMVSTSQTEETKTTKSRVFNVAKYIGKSWADSDDTESESDIDDDDDDVNDPNW